MITETFKTELLTYLSYKDVEFIIEDINALLAKFNPDKKKNYLHILANIFLRYRTQISDIDAIASQKIIEPKEIVFKQDKEKIETIEVENIEQCFTTIDLSFFEKYFSAITYATPEHIPVIDFTRNSIEQNLSHAINSNDKKIGRLNAMRYVLSSIPYPDKNSEILDWYPEVVNVLK